MRLPSLDSNQATHHRTVLSMLNYSFDPHCDDLKSQLMIGVDNCYRWVHDLFVRYFVRLQFLGRCHGKCWNIFLIKLIIQLMSDLHDGKLFFNASKCCTHQDYHDLLRFQIMAYEAESIEFYQILKCLDSMLVDANTNSWSNISLIKTNK